jgi:hypothetical protein
MQVNSDQAGASRVHYRRNTPAGYASYADLEKGRPPNRVMSAAELTAFNALAPPGLITVVSRDITIYDAEMSMVAPPTSSQQ